MRDSAIRTYRELHVGGLKETGEDAMKKGDRLKKQPVPFSLLDCLPVRAA